jgi:hypothetical protein
MTAESNNGDRVLAFAHIGDLHLTDAKQRNTDFLAIVAQIEIEGSATLDRRAARQRRSGSAQRRSFCSAPQQPTSSSVCPRPSPVL